MRIAPLLLLLGSLLLAACDLVEDTPFQEEVVVESYQVAGQPLQVVRLSRSAGIDESYDTSELAIRDAAVQVHLLAEDGRIEQTYAYQHQARGEYVPADVSPVGLLPIVQPLRRYRLEAEVPGFGTVASTTVVPDTFRIVSVNGTRIAYQSPEQFEARITRSQYPGRQNVFIFVTDARNPVVDQLTPFWREVFDEEENTIDEFRRTRSPIINEANYDVNADGTIVVRLPWIAVRFYGPTVTAINAIDDNLYDFIRTLDVQQGGSTLGPGEIPSVLDRVENGTGIFGSYATVTAQLEIEPTF